MGTAVAVVAGVFLGAVLAIFGVWAYLAHAFKDFW